MKNQAYMIDLVIAYIEPVDNYCQLGKYLGIERTTISAYRMERTVIGANFLCVCSEATGIPIKTLKEAAGLPLFKPNIKGNKNG